MLPALVMTRARSKYFTPANRLATRCDVTVPAFAGTPSRWLAGVASVPSTTAIDHIAELIVSPTATSLTKSNE